MAAQQLFSNASILRYLHLAIASNNPEMEGRFIFCEELDYNTLIHKFRSLSNKLNKEDLYNLKYPIIGYTRKAIKRLDTFNQRNIFNVSLTETDVADFAPEIRDYFITKDNTGKVTKVMSLTAAFIEWEYHFIVLNSDIDMLEQYEQAYLNKEFMSNIQFFNLDSRHFGFGSDFNLRYDCVWNDLEDFKITNEGMSYCGFTGDAKITGLILYASGLPQYIIESINVNLYEKSTLTLVEHISIPDTI